MTTRPTVLAFGLLLASGGALAQQARAELETFSNDLRTLDGGFTQQVYDQKGRLKESSSGKVSMAAPNLFRWQYVKPYQQLIVADGTTVWIYEPDLQQVSKRPQGAEEQSSPLAALVDRGRLTREFEVAEAGGKEGLQWLELTPKNKAGASFEKASLGFGQRGLAKIVIHDALGQRTEMNFGTWNRNGRLPASTFRFTPPQGVDVIGQ
ncbi:outer membrane lipoprotein carrier protein LolA [Lysobacter pythonis]|uniref:Outer-membrane lipoprotein carrier protein n=1 Tax=Solilutibacter pythonis TaxID=2483112 RepID=A0A3M2HYK4_9GAMM|nr:outer membrane lipoprotein chaperone LolA [Lysobacter pythonis]RMH94811.1 outer membrane lipoprotein carrier protein LolA [Lysobacter pythonis]